MKDTRFKPGKSGNPSGRPKLPADILQARRLDRFELERLLNRFLHMTKEDLISVSQDPRATMVELLVGSIVNKAVIFGDHLRLDFLLTRLIGKVPDSLEADMVDLLDQIRKLKAMPRMDLLKLASDVLDKAKSEDET